MLGFRLSKNDLGNILGMRGLETRASAARFLGEVKVFKHHIKIIVKHAKLAENRIF